MVIRTYMLMLLVCVVPHALCVLAVHFLSNTHAFFVSLGDSALKDEAWKHKERLLRYDREFAQRTVILDDQADYYNDTTSAWLTEEEQEVAANNEHQRYDDIHKRKKMQLNLGFNSL